MPRAFGLLALLVAFALSPAAAQDIQGPSWKPLAFEVRKPDAENNAAVLLDSGTRVVARLEVPARKVVAIDSKKSKLDSFTDDKNTDLFTVTAPAAGAPRLVLPSIRPESTTRPTDVAFQAPGLPARGASRVRVKGSVVALIGREEKEVEKKDFSLKAGGELDFGSLKPLTTSLTTSTRLTCEGTRPIISITVLDGDGKELPCRITSSASQLGAAGDKPHFRTSITVTGKALDRCTLKVKYYSSVEEVTVPIDLEIGPGF